MAFNPENRITWEELAPSLQELFKNLQSQITREVERARNEELRLDRKIDDEIARAKSEERRIEDKLDDEIDRSTQEDQDIHDELDEIKDQLDPNNPDGAKEIAEYGIRDRFVWVKFTFGLIIQFGVVTIGSSQNWEIFQLPLSFTKEEESFAAVASDVAWYTRNGAHLITAASVPNDPSKVALYSHSPDAPTITGVIAVGY